MKAIMRYLAGGAAIAAFAGAAPAVAQYYPGTPYSGYGYGYPGYGYGGAGEVINQVFGGGYGMNQQVAVNQCTTAVQSRLGGGYGYGYGAPYAGGRVLGVSRVQPNNSGGLTVHGVATSGRYGAYGYGQGTPDLSWSCRTDYRGFVLGVDVHPARPAYMPGYGQGYGYTPYTPGGYDVSQYGYVRY